MFLVSNNLTAADVAVYAALLPLVVRPSCATIFATHRDTDFACQHSPALTRTPSSVLLVRLAGSTLFSTTLLSAAPVCRLWSSTLTTPSTPYAPFAKSAVEVESVEGRLAKPSYVLQKPPKKEEKPAAQAKPAAEQAAEKKPEGAAEAGKAKAPRQPKQPKGQAAGTIRFVSSQ